MAEYELRGVKLSRKPVQGHKFTCNSRMKSWEPTFDYDDSVDCSEELWQDFQAPREDLKSKEAAGLSVMACVKCVGKAKSVHYLNGHIYDQQQT